MLKSIHALRKPVPVLCGLVGLLVCTVAPGYLRAQAPAGPMSLPQPPAETQPAPAASRPASAARTPAAAPKDLPAPRQSIAGSWNFNRDGSDDSRNKLDQARRGGSSQSGGPVGGNGPYGGGPWGGGYPPYPGNGPYGGGPYGGGGPLGGQRGGGRGGYGDESDQSAAMREYVYPATEVTFILKDNEAELTDDAARKRVFFTDGRKLQKPKDESYREIAARWEGNRLVADEKVAGGERVRRVFELSADGRQLEEEVDLDSTRARGAVTLHYVYDINTSRE